VQLLSTTAEVVGAAREMVEKSGTISLIDTCTLVAEMDIQETVDFVKMFFSYFAKFLQKLFCGLM
jgi:hypothetical protein